MYSHVSFYAKLVYVSSSLIVKFKTIVSVNIEYFKSFNKNIKFLETRDFYSWSKSANRVYI